MGSSLLDDGLIPILILFVSSVIDHVAKQREPSLEVFFTQKIDLSAGL